jgi:hypothetical protein
MGKAKNGILGAITGKVGGLSFYEAKGQPRVRAIGIRTAPPSMLQMQQRAKMKMYNAFSNTMKPFLKCGFVNRTKGTTSNYHNLASSYNLSHAISIDEGEAYMDFSKVRLSEGNAAQPLNPQVELTENGLHFSWENHGDESWSVSQDQVMMMAFFPEITTAHYVTSGSRRSQEFDVLNLPPTFREAVMEVYMAFVADDRCNVSDSIYLGRLN